MKFWVWCPIVAALVFVADAIFRLVNHRYGSAAMDGVIVTLFVLAAVLSKWGIQRRRSQ
jgi:hypothetical protein